LNGRFTLSDVDHLGLRIGDSLCLRYVLHGEPVSDVAVLIGHHGEFAVLDEVPMTDLNMLQLERDLDRDEGRRRKPYRDSVGKLTIGVGRNLDDRGLTEPEIDYLLHNDITLACAELDRNASWWRDMPEPWQRGLANMSFNLGWPRLSAFKKMLAALEAGDGVTAAAEALDSKWSAQVGDKASRIALLFNPDA
jgi:lysozyme